MRDTAPSTLRSFVASMANGLPFFYGWVVVAMSIVSGFLASGMTNLVMGVLLKPMTEDLGWSRTVTAGAIMGGTVAGGILAPFIGKLADRRGPRLLVSGGAAIVGVLFLLISQVTVPWQFYAAYVPGRALAQTAMVGVVPLTAVANWFRLKRPRVLGMVNMSLALGGSVMALVAQFLVERFGWRSVPLTFGVLVCTLVVVPAAVLLLRRPEDIGMLPDGGDREERAKDLAAGKQQTARRLTGDEHEWTLQEAMRTRALWLIVASFGLATLANGSVGFHQVAYYTDLGLTAEIAALALSTYAFSGAVSNVVWGFLAERVSERLLNAGALVFSAACLILLINVGSTGSALTFSVLFGLAARGESALINIIIGQYYGRKSFGAISGFTVPFQLTGVGVGPLLAAFTYDYTGSYVNVFVFYIGTYIFSAFLIFLAKRPTPPAPDVAPTDGFSVEGEKQPQPA